MRISPLLLLLASTSAFANEYQSITKLTHANFDEQLSTDNSTAISTIYYLKKKNTLGPLNEFDYINTTNNVFGSYTNHSDSNFGFGGEMFHNQWQLGGSYSTTDSDFVDGSTASITLGYLVQPNLLVNIEHTRYDADYKSPYGNSESFSDNDTSLGIQYTHALQGKDYLGVTVDVDSSFDRISASTKYFSHLGEERYLALGLFVSDYEDSKPIVGIEGTHYFNQRTSVSARVMRNTEVDVTSSILSAQHFINENWSVGLAYSSNEVESFDGMQTRVKDANAISFNVTAQF